MADTDEGIYFDGALASVNQLSYREQRVMRDLAQSLAPNGDIAEASEADLVPAMYTVLKRRTEPNYSLEEALDLKPADLEPPDPPKPRRGAKKAT